MINLLCFLCSICIQFVSFELPYEVNQFEYIDNLKTFISHDTSSPASFRFFADTNTPYVVFRSSYNQDGSGIIFLAFPLNDFNTSLTSSYYVNNYEYINNGVRGDIRFTNFVGASYSIDSTGNITGRIGNFSTSDAMSIPFYIPNDDYIGNYTYMRVLGCYSLVFRDLNSSDIVFLDADALTLPTQGLGSLSGTGHSSGGNPLEDLENFSWSGHSSSYIQSGHNTHVNPSSATPDFTNAEQNLLGQIVDNTNSIIENTNNLGGALETINGNIINGASAIFNAISQFNNNFVSTYVYDQEQVDETLENSSMFLFASTTTDLTETIINESDVLLDAVHDMEEKQDLVIYLDLTKWRVPVYSSSTGVNTSYVKPYNEVVQIDFSFLKETKSIWQPILLGILYLSLFMSIYFDLPNILRGVNG